MTPFSRMRISVAVNGTANSIEPVLNVGLYFEKNGLYSQCHINTCLYSLKHLKILCWKAFSIADSSVHEAFRKLCHVPLEDRTKNALEQYNMPALSAWSNH